MTDPKTHVLIAGANGQLGLELQRQSWPSSVQIHACDRQALDITDGGSVARFIEQGRFGWVINAAAYTNVDAAEDDQEAAFAVNELGAQNLARACQVSGAALIHISTDYVFDGSQQTPYAEEDAVNPMGVYGASKLAGEVAIRDALQSHIILRTAWLVSAHGKNFVRTMIRLAGERDELRVVADQTGSPTAAGDLAAAIVNIITSLMVDGDPRFGPIWGTYHCSNSGAASWCDLAGHIVKTLEFNAKAKPIVTPVTTSEYPTPARRPQNSRLNCSKIGRTFGVNMRPWRVAVTEIIREQAIIGHGTGSVGAAA